MSEFQIPTVLVENADNDSGYEIPTVLQEIAVRELAEDDR